MIVLNVVKRFTKLKFVKLRSLSVYELQFKIV